MVAVALKLARHILVYPLGIHIMQTFVVGDIAYADDAFGHIDYLLSFGYEDVYNGKRRESCVAIHIIMTFHYYRHHTGWVNWMQNVSSVMPFHVGKAGVALE